MSLDLENKRRIKRLESLVLNLLKQNHNVSCCENCGAKPVSIEDAECIIDGGCCIECYKNTLEAEE